MTILPHFSGHSDEGLTGKPPGVGFSRQSDVHPSLPSTPRLPPITNPPVPSFNPVFNPTSTPLRYPLLAELQDSSMRDYPLLYATNPWFSALSVRDVVGIELEFADGAGMLPGHLPLPAISSYDWLARIAVPPSILRQSSSRGLQALSLRFMEAVLARLDRSRSDALIRASFGCDT